METTPEPNAAENQASLPDLNQPPAAAIQPSPPPAPRRPISYWVKTLLVCNPFYLVSAALLLYGFYLVSTDDNFPGKEIAQLAFNFGSLQFYEVLLAGTAILLARRRIWYDSNLLIFLENLLILVPFILVSQAALIGQNAVMVLCLIGGAMACLRFASLKRFHRQLNLPRGLLGCGLVFLLINVALPLVFRHLHESKVGTKPTDGAAFEMNQYSWLLILPALIALGNCLPRPAQTGELLPQRRWVPTGLFILWLAGSVVHLYCLGYVYNFDWEIIFMVPPLWVLAWTLYRRHDDFLPIRGLRPALLLPQAIITLIAVDNSAPGMFLLLTSLNILAYALIYQKERGNKMALNLMILSGAALALGCLNHFESHLPVYLHIENCTLAFATAYVCYWIGVSRNPGLGILGAIVVGIASGMVFQTYFDELDLGIQCGALFLLLHSLLWQDAAHPGARGVRLVGCLIWIMHCVVLVASRAPHAAYLLYAIASLVLAGCVFAKFISRHWPPLVLPVTAGLALLMHPINFTLGRAQATPIGPWVVAGSFLLFAVGTLMALSRSKWNPPAATGAAVMSASEQIKPSQ